MRAGKYVGFKACVADHSLDPLAQGLPRPASNVDWLAFNPNDVTMNVDGAVAGSARPPVDTVTWSAANPYRQRLSFRPGFPDVAPSAVLTQVHHSAGPLHPACVAWLENVEASHTFVVFGGERQATPHAAIDFDFVAFL